MNQRVEKDLLGQLPLPAEALWGIYTQRSVENFPISHRTVHPVLIQAYGAVKLACCQVNYELGYIPEVIFNPIQAACQEMMAGKLNEAIRVDALQGGAGTSTNMNVNEVLANRALQLMGQPVGTYEVIHPLEHINLHQSTNDTYPTALKVAAIWRLRSLEKQIAALVEVFQHKEQEMASMVKVGRTQMQDAVLTTLGREMSAYAEALARDRWRVYKCEERLRVVNLGGTAIGTGILAPRQFIFRVVDQLRAIVNLGLSRAENLVEATQNLDMFVEVSGILKAYASSLIKISGDLRFLSSGPEAGIGELKLPPRQAGSSIMPGKINPVIPEAVTQAAIMVCSNDLALTQAVSMGHLELNPFVPLIADCLLTNLDYLERATVILREFCIVGLKGDPERCRAHVLSSTAVVTALVEELGYDKAQELAQLAIQQNRTIKAMVLNAQLMSEDAFEALVSAERVTRLGYPGTGREKRP